MTKIKVPELGNHVEFVNLVDWVEKDEVLKDEVIAEVETDKATLEIEAPASGKLKKFKSLGESIKVGEVIGEIC